MSINSKHSQTSLTYLHICCIYKSPVQVGDLATVRLVLDHNVDVNVQGGWGLRRAVRYNHPHVWQLLLDNTNTQVVRFFHGISK